MALTLLRESKGDSQPCDSASQNAIEGFAADERGPRILHD